MSACVCLCGRTYTCAYLIKLGPGNHHVAEVVGKVGLVEYLLGQEVLVVVVQIVLRLDLGGEFTVESAVHHPPGHALRHHEWHSVLMTTTTKLADMARTVICIYSDVGGRGKETKVRIHKQHKGLLYTLLILFE